MSQLGFIFQKWERRIPYYALMNVNENKICVLEETWGNARNKGIRVALVTTFGGGWVSVMKEAGNQTLKYGSRRALGYFSIIFAGYLGSAAIPVLTKSAKAIKWAKACHSVCSGGLDMAELCAAAPINIVEILIFGRPIVLEGGGFDLFSCNADPVETIDQILSGKRK